MAEEGQEGEKTEEPSAHRIDEFRKRGEVASSKELTSVLILSVCIVVLGLSLVYAYQVLAEFVTWLYSLDATAAYTGKSLKTIVHHVAMTSFKCVAPVFIASFCIGILANLMQIGFLFSTDVLKFKPERINPVQGIKKLFSIKSLVEAIKGIFKFIIILSILYMFMKDDIKTYAGFLHMDFFHSFLYAKGTIVKIGLSMILGLVVVAIGDFAYQKYSHKKKMMMTKQEAKRELKEQEGNPEVKQRIRSIQREMAQKRMIAEIPGADVIITNPTHLSVILKYDSETMISPYVMGKGADHLAFRIREIAKKHNVPIVENVPLARALYKTVKTGSIVPRALYKAVAEVLAFVYRLKKKEKALK